MTDRGYAWLMRAMLAFVLAFSMIPARAETEAGAADLKTFLTALWPDALGLFEPLAGEAELLVSGIMPASSAALQLRWLDSIAGPLRRLGLPWPFELRTGGWEPQVAPSYGGRRGVHGPSFLALYDTITSVYRIDPGANW